MRQVQTVAVHVVARTLVVTVLGCVFAVGVILLAPKHTVVCNDARWPDSIFGDQFGHVDGATFTGCDVPTTAAWVVALAGVLVPPIAVLAKSTAPRRPEV